MKSYLYKNVFFSFAVLLWWGASGYGYTIGDGDVDKHIPFFEEYVDHSQKLGFAEAKKANWQKTRDVNYGFINGNVWLRFPVKYKGTAKKSFVFEIDNALLNEVEIWIEDRKSKKIIGQEISGLNIPFSDWSVQNRNPTFNLTLEPKQAVNVYFRISADVAVFVPLKIYDEVTFRKSRYETRFGFGIYFGLILGILLFQLVMYSSFRDVTFIYNSCLLVSLHLVLIPLAFGLNTNILLWDNPDRFIAIGALGQMYSALFLSLLLARLVDTKKNYPYAKYMIMALLGTTALFSFKAMIWGINSLDLAIMTGVMIILIGLFFAIAVHSAMRGNTAAKIFLVGWFGLLAGALGYNLIAFNLTQNYGIRYFLLVGALVEAVIITMALHMKIRLVQQSRDQMENEVTGLKQSLKIIAPSDLVNKLLANPELLIGPPTRELITILAVKVVEWSDLENSEETLAFEIKKTLEMVSRTIKEFGGIIDQTREDGVVCFFGYMQHRSKAEQSQAALLCGSKIQEASIDGLLAGKNNELRSCFRVGIHTAQVLVGNMGTFDRPDFTLSGLGVRKAIDMAEACEPFHITLSNNVYNALSNEDYRKNAVSGKRGSSIQDNLASEVFDIDPFADNPDLVRKARACFRRQFKEKSIEPRISLEQDDRSIDLGGERCDLVNISSKGLCFQSKQKWTRGTVIDVNLASSKMDELRLNPFRIIVRWSRAGQDSLFKHGVELVGLNPAQRQMVTSLLGLTS